VRPGDRPARAGPHRHTVIRMEIEIATQGGYEEIGGPAIPGRHDGDIDAGGRPHAGPRPRRGRGCESVQSRTCEEGTNPDGGSLADLSGSWGTETRWNRHGSRGGQRTQIVE